MGLGAGLVTGVDVFIVAFILLVLAVVFGVDGWLFEKGGEKGTISWRVAYWSVRAPIIVGVLCGVLGIVAGHLWWPNRYYCQ